MASPYQDFVRKARERFEAREKRQKTGPYHFTQHARFKMQQYGLSEQRVRSVIRNPKRKEEGIMPKTAAMMQPASVKTVAGKPVWKQEIWVMIMKQGTGERVQGIGKADLDPNPFTLTPKIKIISAWRYPGVSPKRNPIPEEILRELEASEGIV